MWNNIQDWKKSKDINKIESYRRYYTMKFVHFLEDEYITKIQKDRTLSPSQRKKRIKEVQKVIEEIEKGD